LGLGLVHLPLAGKDMWLGRGYAVSMLLLLMLLALSS